MMTYTCEWACEVSADTAEEAVRLALDVFADELANQNVRLLDTYSSDGWVKAKPISLHDKSEEAESGDEEEIELEE